MESKVVGVQGEDGKTSGEIVNAKSDDLQQQPKPEADDDALEAGQLSPLTGSYLLIVIAEPYSEQDRERIIQRLTKGLLSWDRDLSHVDLNCELLNLANSSPEGDEAKNGEKLVQWASENLVVEVLIHSQVNTLQQCMKNLLASFTRHRHIIHAGYTFSGNGSWILQDGTFSLNDFVELWDEPDVSRLLSAYKGDISLTLHCAEHSGWTEERLHKEFFSKLCQVYLNPKPNDKLSAVHNSGITSFIDYISKFVLPSPLDEILQPSDIVGNIRFSHPTLYVFPGGQGDAALFGVNGFNMLIDGGFSRKACYWNFVRHLDRLDAVLLTRINHNSIGGLGAILDRKKISQVFPQIGHFFGNVVDANYVTGKGSIFSSGDEMEKGEKETKKDEPPFENTGDLMISLTLVGQSMLQNLHSLSLKPQLCFREHHIDPINLYHKVGHGKLDLYVLNPAKDSRELKEFLSKWNTTASNKLFVKKCETSGRGQLTFPVLNLVSICALVVWQPTNPKEHITRLLFPGSTPQHRIFEALSKLKHLEFLKFPVCSAKIIAASHKSKFQAYKSEKIVTEVKSQVFSSKSSTTTGHTQVTHASATVTGSKPASATPKPSSPKISLPKTTKTVQNREKQLLANVDVKSDTSSTTGLAVTGEGLLSKDLAKEKEPLKEKPRRGRSETRKVSAASKRVPSSSISRDKEANKKSEKKQQVLKSTDETSTTTTTKPATKKLIRPASAAPAKKDKESPAPKEKASPKKTNGVAGAMEKTPASDTAKSAPVKKEAKFGIGKSIPKSAPAPAKPISDTSKKATPAAQETGKPKEVPKKTVSKPNRTIPQAPVKKTEAPTKTETKPLQKAAAATKKPIPKPAPAKSTSSTAPKPVARKIMGGAAVAGFAGATTAALLSSGPERKKAVDALFEKKDAEVKTNGVAPARDSPINLDSEKFDGTNGFQPSASSTAATESGSEMSSLGHISLNDEELSKSERNETPSSRALTDTEDENQTPKAHKYPARSESRFTDEEDEYLVVEKSTTDESASVEHEMIHQKTLAASSDRGFGAAADFKMSAAEQSLNKNEVDNASTIAANAKPSQTKKEPQTFMPQGAIDIESEQKEKEQQTHEGKFGMVEQTVATASVSFGMESQTQNQVVETKSALGSIIPNESEQPKPTEPLRKENDFAAETHYDEDKSKRQININEPLPSFGLSSAVMEIESEHQQHETASELHPSPIPVLESHDADEGSPMHHHPSAPGFEDDDFIKSESPVLVREKVTTIEPQEKVTIGETFKNSEPAEVFRSASGVSIQGASSVEGEHRQDSSDEYFTQEKVANGSGDAFAFGETRTDSSGDEMKFNKLTTDEKVEQTKHDSGFDKEAVQKGTLEPEEKGPAETILEKDTASKPMQHVEQITTQKQPTHVDSVFVRPIPPGALIRTPDEVADLPVHEVVEPGIYEHEEEFTSEEEDHGVEVIPIVKLPEIQENTSSGSFTHTSSSFQEKADVENMEKEAEAKEMGKDSKSDYDDNQEEHKMGTDSDEQIAKDMTKAIEKISAAISSVFESKAYESSPQESSIPKIEHKEQKEKHDEYDEHMEQYESENYPLASGSSAKPIPVISALTSTSKTSVVVTPSTPPIVGSKSEHFQLLAPAVESTKVATAEASQESIDSPFEGKHESFGSSKETETGHDNFMKAQEQELGHSLDGISKVSPVMVPQQEATTFLSQDLSNERKISSDESTASKTTVISQVSPSSEKTPDFDIDSSTASAIHTSQSTVGSTSYIEEKAKFYVGGDSVETEDDEGDYVEKSGTQKQGAATGTANITATSQFSHAQDVEGHDEDEDTEEEDFANVPSVIGPGLMTAATTVSATVIRHSPVDFATTPSPLQHGSDFEGQDDAEDRSSPDSIVKEQTTSKAEVRQDFYSAVDKKETQKEDYNKETEKFMSSADQAKANNSVDPHQIGTSTMQFSASGAEFDSSYQDDKDVKFTTSSEKTSAFTSFPVPKPQESSRIESQVVKDEVAIKTTATSSDAFSMPGYVQPGASASGLHENIPQEKQVDISSSLGAHKSGKGLDSDSDNEIMPKDIKDKNSENYYEDEDDAEEYDPSDKRASVLEKLAQAEYESVTGRKGKVNLSGSKEDLPKDSLQVGFSGKPVIDADRQTQDVISKLLAEQAEEDDTWRKMETIEASDEEEIPHHFSHETRSSDGQPKTTIEQTKSIQKTDDGSEIETTITRKTIEHPVEIMTFTDDPAKIQEFKDSIEKGIAESNKMGGASPSTSTTTSETIDQNSPFSQSKTTVTTTTITNPAETSVRYSSEEQLGSEQSDEDDYEIKIAKDANTKESSSTKSDSDYRPSPNFGKKETAQFTSTSKDSTSDFSKSNVIQDLTSSSKESAESHKSGLMKEEAIMGSLHECGPGFDRSANMKDEIFSAAQQGVSNEFKSSVTKDDTGKISTFTSESKAMESNYSSGSATHQVVEECKFRIGSTSSTLSTDSEDAVQAVNLAMAMNKEWSEAKSVHESSTASTSYNPFQEDKKIESSSTDGSSAAFDQKAFGSPVTRRFSVQDESQEKAEEHEKLQRRASEMSSSKSHPTPFVPFKATDEHVAPKSEGGQNPFSPAPESSGYISEHQYETMKAGEHETQQPFKSTMYGQQLQNPDSHYFSGHQAMAQEMEEEANSSGEFSDSQLSTMPPRNLQYAMQPDGVRQRQGTFDSDNDDPGAEEYDDEHEHGFDDPDVITPTTTNANATLISTKNMDIENANATSTTTSTTLTISSNTENANTIDATAGLAVTKGLMTTSAISTSSSSTTSSALNFGSTATIQTQYHIEGRAILASDDDDGDIVNKWGKPLGLPGIQENGGASVTTTEPPSAGTETPKKDTGTSTPKKSSNAHKKRSLSARPAFSRNLPPIYVDLAYVPHHGNSNYSDSEFFRLVRSRYYVFSGLEPSRQVFEGLLRGKQAWDDKNLAVTIVPTYDTDSLAYWVIDSEKELHEAKIDLAPSASRCTINLQDHDTSCSAYRLEF